jgi:dTDP-4-amino-4,6-dideoxygalactose transaminase
MPIAPVELLPANTTKDFGAVALGWLAPNLGSEAAIAAFECHFAAGLGEGQAFSFAAGRVALAAILDALGVAAGDEVVIPAYTCVAVPNPILFAGARPVYADIERATLNLSAATVLPVLSAKTRAIVVQHTFGLPCRMDELVSLARQRGIAIIEDCSHALGASMNGRPVGVSGDASFFSLEQTKVISAGAGGVAFVRDPALASRLKAFQRKCCVPATDKTRRMMGYLAYTALLRDPRWSAKLPNAQYYLARLNLIRGPISTDEEMRCDRPADFEGRLSGAQARVGSVQLRHLADNLAQRRAIASIYDELLRDSPVTTYSGPSGSVPAYVRYPIRVRDKHGLARDLRDQAIQLGLWFTAPVHPVEVPQSKAGYAPGSCPEGESAVAVVANLPCHPRMTLADARRVAAAVIESRHA